MTDGAITYGKRVANLAADRGDAAAIRFRSRDGIWATRTWRDLDRRSNQMARWLTELGTSVGDMVVVGLPNSIEHFEACLAIWKVGACVVPVSYAAPPPERDRIVGLARPSAVIGSWEDRVGPPQISRSDFARLDAYSADALEDRVSDPGMATSTGGSTGTPKLVIWVGPHTKDPDQMTQFQILNGLRPNQRQLVSGPLYHNAPWFSSWRGLFAGHALIVTERFDAAVAVDLLERERINWGFFVPTMLIRMARIPELLTRDLSSVHAIYHAGASCPEWAKRFWIELVGPARLREGFGPSESFSTTVIRGEEYLEHPGSVGRPLECEIKILDNDRREVPQGIVGEIWGRPVVASERTYRYLGAPPAKSTPDGFQSVGDMGWLDADGYLYIADRLIDMIVRGGANIYPAEVEAALSDHPDVADVVVVGLPDSDLGKRVHAVIRPRDPTSPPSSQELSAHAARKLAKYKVPASYEFLAEFPRDENGKIRRTRIAAERQ